MRSIVDQPRQIVQVIQNIAQPRTLPQVFAAITKNEKPAIIALEAFFLNGIERLFMAGSKNREERRAVQMIKRVISPFARRHPCRIGVQDHAQFATVEIARLWPFPVVLLLCRPVNDEHCRLTVVSCWCMIIFFYMLHGIDDIGQVGFAILSLIGSTFL